MYCALWFTKTMPSLSLIWSWLQFYDVGRSLVFPTVQTSKVQGFSDCEFEGRAAMESLLFWRPVLCSQPHAISVCLHLLRSGWVVGRSALSLTYSLALKGSPHRENSIWSPPEWSAFTPRGSGRWGFSSPRTSLGYVIIPRGHWQRTTKTELKWLWEKVHIPRALKESEWLEESTNM